MDVETVLASVQERDKWRRRLELLQESRREIREHLRRVGGRVRRLKQELGRLQELSQVLIGAATRIFPPSQRINARSHPNLPAR